MERHVVERVSALFGALSNPTRVHILGELIKEPLKVTAIAERLNIGQPSVSQHLAVMERVGLITVTAMGTSRVYRVRGPRVAQLLDTVVEFCHVHGLKGIPEDDSDDV